MEPSLVQRCPRYRRLAGGPGCSPASAPSALASPSADCYLPHCVFWMRFHGSSWRNALPLRLCCSRGLRISDQHSSASRLARKQEGAHKTCKFVSLDAFGGGFLTDALVAYWFYRRFGVAEESLGILFFAVHLLNAASHLGAAWLARRIGLVKTMVFTHLPSSLFLIAAAFAPSLKMAIVLFLCREALVEMDVPTRQSYVAAVVLPSERTFASGIANLSRNS